MTSILLLLMACSLLAGLPAALLVFAATNRQRDGGYAAGFAAGQRQAHADMLAVDAPRVAAHQSAKLPRQAFRRCVDCPTTLVCVADIHGRLPCEHASSSNYTMARPFAAPDRLPTSAGDVVDEDELDWDDPVILAKSMRQFRITGEVER